jgi:hypothetical protein
LVALASAKKFIYAAMGAVLAITLVLGVALRKKRFQDLTFRWPLIAIFLIAGLADLATTLVFFHTQGVNYEVHPGIRLIGYAYGRTIGPILGKTFQIVGIVFISAIFPRFAVFLLCTASLFCGLAAIHNIMNL